MIWISLLVGLDVWNLSEDLTHHVLSGGTDSRHSQSREGIWDHSTEQKTSEGEWLEDVDVESSWVSLSNTGDVGTEESESNEASRADSEALTNSSGSVTSGIESISSFTDVSVKSSHLSNTTSVVRDRAVSINREADGEAAEHTESSESNTVHSGPLEGEEHSDGEAHNGNNAGHVAKSETIDNVGGSTVEAGFGEVTGGGISVRSVVLSGESDNEAGPETKQNAAVAFPLLGFVNCSSE